jgi:hypothetical protein
MAAYTFETNWMFEDRIEYVWDVLSDVNAWSEWWPGVSIREIDPGDENGLEAVRHYVFRTKLPYKIEFYLKTMRIEAPMFLEGKAYGSLIGNGCWDLREEAGRTYIRYIWKVETTKAWMNWIAPMARAVFEWNHDQVMRSGEEALRRRLQERVAVSV